MTYLNSPRDQAQRSAIHRSQHKTHSLRLNWRLILLAVALSTPSYPRGAVRGDVAASPGISAASSIENVTVAMDLDRGPATYRATGFLHTFSSTAPSDDLVAPLKPHLFRLNATESWACYPRVKRLGA